MCEPKDEQSGRCHEETTAFRASSSSSGLSTNQFGLTSEQLKASGDCRIELD